MNHRSWEIFRLQSRRRTQRIKVTKEPSKREGKVYKLPGLVLYRIKVHYPRIETTYTFRKPASSVLQHLLWTRMQSNGERLRVPGFFGKLSRHNDLRTCISTKVLSRWLEGMGAPALGWNQRDSAQQKAEYLATALNVRRHGQTRSRLSGLTADEVDTITKLVWPGLDFQDACSHRLHRVSMRPDRDPYCLREGRTRYSTAETGTKIPCMPSLDHGPRVDVVQRTTSPGHPSRSQMPLRLCESGTTYTSGFGSITTRQWHVE
jgi:hypothetical protein